MKREDITTVFPDATKEQIDALLNIHSADIGKLKGDNDTAEGTARSRKRHHRHPEGHR